MSNTTESPILLVSPREPSGVSWIINCLLELGIRVDLQPTADQIFGVGMQPASAMWLPEPDGRWRLHPRASALQKWLPILSREETLTFRAAPPILHIQRLPRREESQQQIILFVRDPRDALHSLYRRTQPELSWNEYIHWPQAETLLGAIDYWRLFIECWSDFRSVFIGRFEDYKANATMQRRPRRRSVIANHILMIGKWRIAGAKSANGKRSTTCNPRLLTSNTAPIICCNGWDIVSQHRRRLPMTGVASRSQEHCLRLPMLLFPRIAQRERRIHRTNPKSHGCERRFKPCHWKNCIAQSWKLTKRKHCSATWRFSVTSMPPISQVAWDL
jgi:hypothetical protein